jgi:hypothetical protein
VLVRNYDRKTALGKLNIKMDLIGADLEGMDYSYGSGSQQMVGYHQKDKQTFRFHKM